MLLPALTPKRTLLVPDVGVDREPSEAMRNCSELFVDIASVPLAGE